MSKRSITPGECDLFSFLFISKAVVKLENIPWILGKMNSLYILKSIKGSTRDNLRE